MKRKIKIIITTIILIAVIIIFVILGNNDKSELKTIKSNKELLKIYNGDQNVEISEILTNIATIPFSLMIGDWNYPIRYYTNDSEGFTSKGLTPQDLSGAEVDTIFNTSVNSGSSIKKDYSTTNIQVENVDEADITKTDGDYIYSISGDNVIITNAINAKEIKIEATIKLNDGSIPEELIIYKNQLVVIATKSSRTNNDTIVKIYDITSKSAPKLLKSYELYEPYYTSRCINNMLYVISSGNLRKEDEDIITYYKEDNARRDIELENMKYLKDVKTRKQTLISAVNLDNVKSDVKVNSYLMDISNAYVSENNIYLLNQKYGSESNIPSIKTIFGFKGIIGLFTDYDYEYNTGYYTEIYKFNIKEDGQVKYDTKAKIEGKTINQYSIDEQNGHLRVALYDNDGSRIVIFDEKLKQIGISEKVAKGETMYSSRFIGDKVYLVTYKTVDPLFVIDLSDETKPQVLGELKIPGYSTYLHPYDENHIIGIGMETEEVVNRNSSGRVISTTSRIIGMKMALFDVSDVEKPVQISSVVIGDRRTTSAILTNPKALLFSKEKSLIAIPVNNYSEDFEVNNTRDSYLTEIDAYKNYSKPYISEGYFVYNIDKENGFKLKGTITHEKETDKKQRYSYYNNSKLLRELYIDNNLFTVSETAVKVNDLETLELINEVKIIKGEY